MTYKVRVKRTCRDDGLEYAVSRAARPNLARRAWPPRSPGRRRQGAPRARRAPDQELALHAGRGLRVPRWQPADNLRQGERRLLRLCRRQRRTRHRRLCQRSLLLPEFRLVLWTCYVTWFWVDHGSELFLFVRSGIRGVSALVT